MEKDTRQLDLFAKQKDESVSDKEAKVVSMQDYEKRKQRQRIIEWTLKNVPSF